MKTINSSLHKDVLETYHLKIGNFYFFENVVIAEIKEGIHLNSTNSRKFLQITNAFFKNKAFVYIANRVNRYSVSLLDFANYSQELSNVKLFSTVIYNNHFDEMNTELEKHFIKKPYNVFNNIEDAYRRAKVIRYTN